ncbi:beta-ketoacyl synthase N-terminal-like domain-containing protein [Streptomyces sp. NBRC 109706]|uniref:beta-ketoacyl synthase N-terminal-like domain-containing protein n=1 Tax=Streptomyces sp. NBRC 109706 TaxID=1550035 RepID=UPI000784B48E|nr:beta-ketoacyl synthase N-terminal-like domain-containing protein [Streptomyces sp. NBRC 109706]
MTHPAPAPTADDLAGSVAITGMHGRFPGAADLDTYWANLRQGTCSLRDFSADELRAAGVPEDELSHPAYVPTKGWLADADRFDAAAFGFHRAEAAALDPQHRLLLESAWAALEDAGYHPDKAPARTAVYVGGSLTEHLFAAGRDRRLATTIGATQLRILTDREFLAPWISYRLGLDGPSMTVQTACSTSLAAVHLAVQALLGGECDAALAGGVAVDAVEPRGYTYYEGGIYAPDGRCRPFDEHAAGTVPGNGVGLVVLRRLEDALADGDPVHAVIRGTAVTNDGAGRVGFTAPGVAGQTAAIEEAWSAAGLDPAQARYLEAHGTGTRLGDRVEAEAAAAAFAGAGRGRVALGSVKANIGHLDAAAGVAALIKTALMLHHRTLVPSAGVSSANPELGLDDGPFRLPRAAEPWPGAVGVPRLAGVSSIGIGGTNVHAVLAEAPERPPGARRAARTPRVFTRQSYPALRPADPPPATSPGGEPVETADDLGGRVHALLIEALELPGEDALDVGYFEAGGDSLTAVHLIGRLRDEHGVEVPITLFLEEAPLRELAARIVAEVNGTAEGPLASLLDEIENENEG